MPKTCVLSIHPSPLSITQIITTYTDYFDEEGRGMEINMGVSCLS